MQEVMTRIELGGVLGKTFGKIHHRLISRVSEAGVALAKTVPGFEQFMISSQRRGITYSVFKGKKNIGVDDLGFPVTGDVIRIVPVIIGSKKAGLIQTILGAVLVIASIWMPGLSIAASNMMFAAGASITLGGVVQMISPQATGLASKQSSDNRASYAFGGVTNTAAQGYPVPLLYGRRRIGGAIISAGIYVEDQQ
ncbi:tail assembly protein [Klebsiella pneumoniae]|jgi:predicted phage tail protein|uniref:tail assembly protein n=1 Tax=Enterobacteriaceae TaxID=543 RepID=UPI0012EA7A1F|nr:MULTISPECIES: tail assembly protein [Enterobacteriaceae]HDT1335701.1 tail assembly protein [Klebsiella pneumoniae subsp. ozaenae]WIB80528.1 tail assembly protein [Klebsiella pneumoniae]WIB85586.1 tail assembly protein [Klebsiella pneumoniae]WIC30301.1 tail assembly protein [Klebsiella pneumoniae]HBS0698560.1 tail assembly protein [Klebsiella pneumoniae]